MRRSRVIPCLTVLDGDLVKTVNFHDPRYVGDPVNAVKLFNEMEVDELVVIDIGASRNGTAPDRELIADLASEAFMPIAYGGGVSSADEAAQLSAIGVEKIIVDSGAIANPRLVSDIAARLGSSSTVGSISISRDRRGQPRIFDPSRRLKLDRDPIDRAGELVELGAGEILLNDVDRDGRYLGFDTGLIQAVAAAVDVPVIACGGAGSVDDLAAGVAAGASAVAAGSLFMFFSSQRGVLINYPDEAELAAVMP
jgi:cyclase